MRRGLLAEIDLGAAGRNLRGLKDAAGGRPVIAVVKAGAYGHGAVELARAFVEAGASMLAVAFVSEARDLRGAGISAPILVLFDSTEVPACFDLSLTPVVHNLNSAREYSREAMRLGMRLGVHLKLDTGMGRMGFASVEGLVEAAGLEGLGVEGVMSHFSDADLRDADVMNVQLRSFAEAEAALGRMGMRPMRHIANSAAALCHAEAHLDAIRPGLALYGCSPFETGGCGVGLEPVMRVSAGIAELRRLGKGATVSYGRAFVTARETLAAVLAAGYADGYPRACSNRAHVLVNGRRARVMGRVCMDLTVVDVTDVEGVSAESRAVLLGRDGQEEIGAWELAGHAGTIAYEVLTGLGGRAAHVYNGGGG